MKISISIFVSVSATLIFLLTCISFPNPATSTSSSSTLVYKTCSPEEYSPGSQFDVELKTLLTKLLDTAVYSTSNNLTLSGDVQGLFQCRRDIPDCPTCVSSAISQLTSSCPTSASAALRLNGCFIRYDNAPFFGVEDKTVVVNQCGPAQITDPAQLDRVNSLLTSLVTDQSFQVGGGDGDMQGVAECVGGLGPTFCLDCLTEAVTLLKSACLYAASGKVFLTTCYATYTVSATLLPQPITPLYITGVTNDGETHSWRVPVIIIGIIASLVV